MLRSSIRVAFRLLAPASAAAAALAVVAWLVLRVPDALHDAVPGDKPSIDIVADLRWRWTGAMPVTLALRNAEPGEAVFAPPGKPPEHRHLLLRFTDGSGRTLAHRVDRDGRYRVTIPDGVRTIAARYLVRPGGWGRHGKQGHVGGDFAVFDGRVLMLPAARPASARVRFLKPDDWKVAGPLQADGEWHRYDDFGTGDAAIALVDTCVGVGAFDTVSRRIGAMDARVASPRDWPAEHRDRLADRSLRLLEYFHEVLGLDTGSAFAVVWTPKVSGVAVMGGASVAGTCFDHSVDHWRKWQLLAHRIAHVFNEYRPTGFTVADEADRWFTEGWASYVEIEATGAVGIEDRSKAWSRLHDDYFVRWRARNPEFDIALADEPRVKPGGATEFLHYMKAPLVVKMLDREIRARAGRDMEGFMREVAARHGRHRSPLPLREAVERYAGVPLDDFWARQVDVPGTVEPPVPANGREPGPNPQPETAASSEASARKR